MADPALKTAAWRRIRAHWLASNRPCARCGGPIDRTAPKGHPRALVVGHIVGRDEARAAGWPESRTNALQNTQPECTECSARSGGAYAAAKHRPRARPIEANEW